MLFLPLQVQIKHMFKEHIDQLTIQSNVVKGQTGWFGAVPLDGNVHIAVLSLNVILLCGAHTQPIMLSVISTESQSIK